MGSEEEEKGVFPPFPTHFPPDEEQGELRWGLELVSSPMDAGGLALACSALTAHNQVIAGCSEENPLPEWDNLQNPPWARDFQGI